MQLMVWKPLSRMISRFTAIRGVICRSAITASATPTIYSENGQIYHDSLEQPADHVLVALIGRLSDSHDDLLSFDQFQRLQRVLS